MVEKEQIDHVFSEEEYIQYIHRLQKTIQLYEQLAEKVKNANVIDGSIYATNPDIDWLLIDREDYSKTMETLSKIDLWKPWNHTIQPRLLK